MHPPSMKVVKGMSQVCVAQMSRKMTSPYGMVREVWLQAAETEAWKQDLLVPSSLLFFGFIFVSCRYRKYVPR